MATIILFLLKALLGEIITNWSQFYTIFFK